MSVVECDVPFESAPGRALIERADFRDAFRAPLRRPDLGVIDIFLGIFAHRPAWMNLTLIARNKIAKSLKDLVAEAGFEPATYGL